MRWADLDMLGHVNNVTYVDYLQEARVDMLRTHGAARTSGDLAEGVVVVRHEVTYLCPLRFRFRPVKIECWVTEIRAASFTMAYEIFHDDGRRRPGGLPAGDDRADAVRLRGRAPRRIAAEERQTLEEFLEPAERRSRTASPWRRTELGHYPVHVRFSDVDVYGHVNNVKYFEYFQEARILLVRGYGAGHDVPRMHIVVAQTDVDYRLPILFRAEPYDCWSQVVRRRASLGDARVGDLGRRHPAGAGPGGHGLLRPRGAALGRAAGRVLPRTAGRAAG